MNELAKERTVLVIQKMVSHGIDDLKKSPPDKKIFDRKASGLIEDYRLRERIRNEEPAALLAVAQTYMREVFLSARSCLDPDLAEEVTQETFLTFIEKAKSFEGRSKVRTWLFGILYRKISHLRRKRGRDLLMDDVDEHFEQRFHPDGKWARPPQPVDEQLYQSEVRRLLQLCLKCLPNRQRMAFVLREVQGLCSNEICKILEVSRTNLGVIMFRARNGLRECLEKHGVSV